MCFPKQRKSVVLLFSGDLRALVAAQFQLTAPIRPIQLLVTYSHRLYRLSRSDVTLFDWQCFEPSPVTWHTKAQTLLPTTPPGNHNRHCPCDGEVMMHPPLSWFPVVQTCKKNIPRNAVHINLQKSWKTSMQWLRSKLEPQSRTKLTATIIGKHQWLQQSVYE